MLTPSDVATLLVGGLGQNGTLEELEIVAWTLLNQVGLSWETRFEFVSRASHVWVRLME